MHTHSGEVQEAWEGDGPEVLGVDHVTTIELEGESMLDTWASEIRVKQTNNQPKNHQPTHRPIGT